MSGGLALAWRLARRELRGGVKGFRIFIACLALGVAAIAAVQSVADGVQRGLREDGRAILGGDMAIRQLYHEFTPEQRAFLSEAGRIGYSAEMRAMARTADAQSDRSTLADRSTLVELKAVDGAYPLFGEMKLAAGGALDQALAQRDGTWGAVAEQATLDRLGLAPGDAVMLGEARLVIRDAISREPDRVGSGGFSIGPRLMISLDALPETGLAQPGALIYWNAKVAAKPGLDPRAWREAAEERYGDEGWRVRDYANASPQLSRFIDRLAQFMTLVGLTALLVGGVGVSNAVRAHLDSRAGVIAVMKCVGAPPGLVARMFLLQLLALAAAGVVLGMIGGAALPLAAQAALADLLPVQAKIGVQTGALAPAAAFGALTALAFSLWPLGRADAVSPSALFRDRVAPARGRPKTPFIVGALGAGAALAALAVLSSDNKLFALWFVAGSAVAFGLFRLAALGAERLAAAAPRPKRNVPLRLALANLHRPGNSVAAVAVSLGLGLTVLATISLVEGNFARRVGEATPATAPSFFFIDIQSAAYPAFKQAVEAHPGVSKVEGVPSLRGRIATVNGRAAEEMLVDRSVDWVLRGDRGVSYAVEQPSDAPIVAGEWWPADYRGPPLLSIDDDVAKAFNIGVGARIGVNVLGRVIEGEVANVRHIDFSTMSLNFILVFSPGVLEAAPHTWVAAAYADPAAEPGLQKMVLAGWSNVTAIRLKEALETAAGILTDVGAAVRAVAAVALAAGALVLAGALAAGHNRRVYDAVVLKVLGASRRTVLGAYLLEYGLLGLAAAAMATGLGTVVAWAVVTQVMGFEWTFLPMAAVSTALIALAATLGLGLFGTWRALGAPAAPLLRNE